MSERYVIVGAGQAGRRAAEELRALRHDLEIVLVGEEPELPYDRPVLSKQALVDSGALTAAFINPPDFYREQHIQLRTGQRVESIDRQHRLLLLAGAEPLAYDKLLLATGSRARRLDVPGASLPGVFHLRTVADARALKAALRHGVRATVIGGGFIGLEVAATLRQHFDAAVTVLESGSRLLARAMPRQVSQTMQERHAAEGVALHFNARIQAIEKTPAGTLSVQTSAGAYQGDIVIVGIGAEPNTELAKAAGLTVNNGIVVNACGETDDPVIFAAGDVTSHYHPWLKRYTRTESWQVAEHQAPLVARRMCGADTAYELVPWLWSDQYDLNLQMLGDVDAVASWVLRGGTQERTWAAIGLDGASRPVALVASNAGRDMTLYRRLVQAGRAVEAHHLQDPATSLRALCAT